MFFLMEARLPVGEQGMYLPWPTDLIICTAKISRVLASPYSGSLGHRGARAWQHRLVVECHALWHLNNASVPVFRSVHPCQCYSVMKQSRHLQEVSGRGSWDLGFHCAYPGPVRGFQSRGWLGAFVYLSPLG